MDALARAGGVRQDAAHALRVDRLLPPDGTDNRTVTTFFEIVRDLDMLDEIQELYPTRASGNRAQIGREADVTRAAIAYRRAHGLPPAAPRATREERSARAKAAWTTRRANIAAGKAQET